MSQTERILYMHVRKLFPRFSTPAYSRFSDLFSELSSNSTFDQLKPTNFKESEDETNLEKYRINPEKIIDGIEKRTSVIIKGIPANFGALNFYKLLTKFCSEINFFYIPGFALAKWEYIYAFVTIGHRKGVLNIFLGLNSLKNRNKILKGFDFSKIEIYFCKSQNIIGLTKKYQQETNQKNFVICK